MYGFTVIFQLVNNSHWKIKSVSMVSAFLRFKAKFCGHKMLKPICAFFFPVVYQNISWKTQQQTAVFGVYVSYKINHFLPNSSHMLMTVSSKLVTYHLTLVLKCFRLMMGYATSCPGPWKVISPPRFVFLKSAPKLRSRNVSSFGVSSLIPEKSSLDW